MADFTWEQQVVLALVPKFTSSLGIISSVFIISELIRDQYNNEGNPINRILFGVTIFEILDSFGWFLSSWALPSDQTDFAFAVGTVHTCNLQGILLQSAIGAPLHNCALTCYFYLVVSKHYTTAQLQSLEWKVHAIIDSYAFGISVALLALKQYNPSSQVCWVNGSPPQCGSSIFGSTGGDAFVPCERGNNANLYGFFCFYFLVWCIMIVIIVLNLLMRRLLIRSSSMSNSPSNNDDVRWITTQAALFSLAFFVTWGPSTVWSTMTWTNAPQSFPVNLLASICEPLQGLWNMLIFIRNRPESVKRLRYMLRYPGGGFCCCCVDENDINSIGNIGADDYNENGETVQISKEESGAYDDDGVALSVPVYVITNTDTDGLDDIQSELEVDLNEPNKD